MFMRDKKKCIIINNTQCFFVSLSFNVVADRSNFDHDPIGIEIQLNHSRNPT